MKVIIVGATGLVGTDLLRQAVLHPSINTIVAVTRRALSSPLNDSPKIKNVLVKDYDQYSDEAKSAFKGANGCIWTIAITPSKSSNFPWEEVVRVCHTSTMIGLRAIYESGTSKPFRFIYMSGIAAERDQTKTPTWKPQYSLMRVGFVFLSVRLISAEHSIYHDLLFYVNITQGETENQVLQYCRDNEIEAAVAKPGLITNSFAKRAAAAAIRMTMGVPSIEIGQCAKAMLEQLVHGIEKEPLMNDDLIEIAERKEESR